MGTKAYGGQAVIEGVMMRGSGGLAVAVRRPGGGVFVETRELTGVVYRNRWFKLPFLRGIGGLWEALVLGTQVLLLSAEVSIGEEAKESKGSKWALWGSVAVGLGLAVGLFFILPAVIASAMDSFIGSSFWSNLVEKVIRLLMIIGYMAGVGLMPDVRRVFRYHGAEHKVINAFEAGAPLDPASVQKFSTAHPRCGTSFLLIVVVISFLAFLLLGQPPMVWRILSRVVLIPVVAGVAFEFVRFGGKHYSNPVMKVLLAPGMALQKLTTRQPDDSMVEVAAVALKTVIEREAVGWSEVPREEPATQASEQAALAAGSKPAGV